MSAIRAAALVAPFAHFGHLRPENMQVDAEVIAEAARADAKVEGDPKPRPTNLGWQNPDWWQDRHYERR